MYNVFHVYGILFKLVLIQTVVSLFTVLCVNDVVMKCDVFVGCVPVDSLLPVSKSGQCYTRFGFHMSFPAVQTIGSVCILGVCILFCI